MLGLGILVLISNLYDSMKKRKKKNKDEEEKKLEQFLEKILEVSWWIGILEIKHSHM